MARTLKAYHVELEHSGKCKGITHASVSKNDRDSVFHVPIKIDCQKCGKPMTSKTYNIVKTHKAITKKNLSEGNNDKGFTPPIFSETTLKELAR